MMGIRPVPQQVEGLVVVVSSKLPRSELGRWLRDVSCALRGYQ